MKANRATDSKVRRYLATLPTRPEHHQKRFALAVSGTTTLVIFTIWCLATFGGQTGPSTLATAPASSVPVADAVSPVASLKASVSEGWQELTGQLNKAEQGLQAVNVDDSNTQNAALNYNGQ